MIHAYPHDLAAFLFERWFSCNTARAQGASALPIGLEALESILSIAYQATLLREEERPTTFRLVLSEPSDFDVDGGPPTGFHRLVFAEALRLGEHELRRLAPAAKYHRALIGVSIDSTRGPIIWGMLQSGAQWLRASHGGRPTHASPPPNAIVVRAMGPGRLAVARGDETLGELYAGQIAHQAIDVFESKWLPARFADARGELFALHEEARSRSPLPWGRLDPQLPSLLSQHVVRRLIATMRSAHHGGTIVFLPPESADELIADSGVIHLKHAFRDDEPRRRFRTLILRVMNAVAAAAATPSEIVGFASYQTSTSREIEEIDEAIFELSQLIAALADVDGAVVLTKRFEILGFGAEFGGAFGAETVDRALDLEGEQREPERIDRVGTRHRSAYRLCERAHEAVSIVISQDGNVRVVAWMVGRVVCFDHVDSATLGE